MTLQAKLIAAGVTLLLVAGAGLYIKYLIAENARLEYDNQTKQDTINTLNRDTTAKEKANVDLRNERDKLRHSSQTLKEKLSQAQKTPEQSRCDVTTLAPGTANSVLWAYPKASGIDPK